MNKTFAECATPVAFSLSLTRTQCHVLLRIRRSRGLDQYCFRPHQAQQLRQKGLVAALTEKDRKKADSMKSGAIYRLTKAGELLCSMLDEAGITLDSTRTYYTVSQEEYWRFAKTERAL